MFVELSSFPGSNGEASHFARLAHPTVVPATGWYDAGKRVGDLGGAALLFVISLPIVLAAMALIRLTSRGPALYWQTRVGRGGRHYTILKLRTMFHECEKVSGPQWASKQDRRITPLGRWLRRLHIDEMPQFWNVLCGDMSLIGPRPERPEFVAKLQNLIPGYRERLLVKPGISGLAQVQLPPDTDIESVRRKICYDHYYIERVSAALDVRLGLATIGKMLHIPFKLTAFVLRLPDHRHVEPISACAASTETCPDETPAWSAAAVASR